MPAIARDYFDGIVIVAAAEWMYATWRGRAARPSIFNPEPKRWVELHAEPEFHAQAEWLGRQIDEGGDLDAEQHRRLSRLVGRALELETGFHDAPFAPVGRSP